MKMGEWGWIREVGREKSCRTQPREERYQLMAGAPFSWKEQRASVGISARVGSTGGH